MKAEPEFGLFGLCLRTVSRMLTSASPVSQGEIGRAILAMAESDQRTEVVEVAGQLKAELERRDGSYSAADTKVLEGMRARQQSDEPRRQPDIKSELVRSTIFATEAAGLMDQPAFLSAIGMRERWIVDAISKPDDVPLEQYVEVYDKAADQAGWQTLHEILHEVTARQRYREWP